MDGTCVTPGTYVLRVTGDSLRDQLLCKGDLLILAPVIQATDGDVVLALTNGNEPRIGRYFGCPQPRAPGGAFLASTITGERQWFPSDHLRVQGVVRGVIRSYSQTTTAPL